MFGDMMQLPPVVTNDEGNVLSEFYDDFYFFNARVFENTKFHTVELTEIFRQTDKDFIDLLSDVREGKLSDKSKDMVKQMMNTKQPDKAIHLCALRNVAESYNTARLGSPTHIIKAVLTGDFNPKNALCRLNEHILSAVERVVYVENDSPHQDLRFKVRLRFFVL
jgi:hypothetical protein